MSPGEEPGIFKGFCTDGHFTLEETGWMQKSTVTEQIVVENQAWVPLYKYLHHRQRKGGKKQRHVPFMLLNIKADI